MSPRKILCILMYFAPASILGQTTPDLPPQSLEAPAPATAVPHMALNQPGYQSPGSGQAELQSFLDTQSELDRRRMLDKQQRTFQLEIDGRYAKALKAYCDTGYGDDRCFRPETTKPTSTIEAMPAPAPSRAVPPPPAVKLHPVPAEGHELPSVAQISGFGEDLSAVLVFVGGKRLRVLGPGPNGPRSQLPDGETVVSIRPGEVLVSRPGDGKPRPLLFQAAAGYGGSD